MDVSADVYSDDQKILGHAFHVQLFSGTTLGATAEQHSEANLPGRTMPGPEKQEYWLMAPLSQATLAHLEDRRQRNERRDVALRLNIHMKVLVSNLAIAPVQRGSIQQGSGYLEILTPVRDPSSWSSSDINDWHLGVNDRGTRIFTIQDYRQLVGITIPGSKWVYDFAPALRLGRFLVAEIPLPESVNGLPERLSRAISVVPELERDFRAGEWDDVVSKGRQVAELLRGSEFDEFLRDDLGYDESAIEAFKKLVEGLFDFPSRAIHQTSRRGVLQPPMSPGMESAQVVYAGAVGIVNLLARKWRKGQQ